MFQRCVPNVGVPTVTAILLALGSTIQAKGPAVDPAAIDEYMAGKLKEGKYPSLSIGVVSDQKLTFVRAYGVADRASGRQATPDSLYFIGSITKVFTTTLMCVLRDQGRLRLDDPVSKYLPGSVKLPTDPRGAPAITLRHLATQSSGLSRLPPNLTGKGGDAYGGYTVEQLYVGLSQLKLAGPIGAEYRYSNLGVGLLGHVLERAAGEPYERTLKKELLNPLGMRNTSVRLSPQQRARLTTGYQGTDFRDEAPEWDLGCLVGAGGLVSSVTDLAKFVSLQLRAGQAGVKPVSGGTLTELHTPQRLAGGWDSAVGLGWNITPLEGIGDVVWHNGGVAGHFGVIGFTRELRIGVIVLTNASKSVDEIGFWLLATAVERSKKPVSATQDLPAAEALIDKYIAATGGAKARAKVRNVVTRGKANLAGLELEWEAYNAAPARFYLKMQKGPAVLLKRGTDGETVWERGPAVGARIVTGAERELVLRKALLHRDVKWRELYKAARCTGVTDFGGHRCYKVVMTPKSGSEETRYYDVKSSLLIGTETTLEVPMLGKQTVREVLDDYREFDGVLYPCRMVQKVAGMEMKLTVESVEHNTNMPPERFEIPPDVRKLLHKQATTVPKSNGQ